MPKIEDVYNNLHVNGSSSVDYRLRTFIVNLMELGRSMADLFESTSGVSYSESNNYIQN